MLEGFLANWAPDSWALNNWAPTVNVWGVDTWVPGPDSVAQFVWNCLRAWFGRDSIFNLGTKEMLNHLIRLPALVSELIKSKRVTYHRYLSCSCSAHAEIQNQNPHFSLLSSWWWSRSPIGEHVEQLLYWMPFPRDAWPDQLVRPSQYY